MTLMETKACMEGKSVAAALRRAVLVLLVMILALTPSGLVYAALPDEGTLDIYNANGIYYYNPNGSLMSCYSGNLSGDTVMAKIVSYLKGNNPAGFVLSDNGIAGILANFQMESGFNPFRLGLDSWVDSEDDPEHGYGIAQFTPKKQILQPLRTDPRTANYFNTYYDFKYTSFDRETGFPDEPVPMAVIDAWLAVQLDYFFGSSSEFETTPVGRYRNMGGIMGLDYISNSMTSHEAMDAARTPEDAARIFVWIMERPARKEEDANKRGAVAAEWLSYVQKISTSGGSATSSASVDGSQVTIIGDSITVGSTDQLEKALPGVDIHAQVSKQFYNGSTDNPGGIEVLQSLVSSKQLRSTLVYALGTNGNFTSEQAQEVVDLAGSSRKVIFVTNWTTSNDYTANNNVLAKMANDNRNVSIADWKGAIEAQASNYLGPDGIHPSAEGQELFAKIISNAVGASKDVLDECSSMGLVEGGMNESQAQELADYYNGSEVDASYWGLPSGKTNCVSFSAFFVQRFTSFGRSPDFAWGNGKDTAHTIAQAKGLPEGTEPRPYAVFSITNGTTICEDGYLCGHTGVVVGVEGDKIITVEAAYPDTLAYTSVHDISYFVNTKYGNTFVYLDSILNQSDLSGF